MTPPHIVVFGGSGFLGRSLDCYFLIEAVIYVVLHYKDNVLSLLFHDPVEINSMID